MRADVVIPVYRDVSVTRECIESVLAHSGAALASIIIVNDCGPEAEMLPMLRSLRDRHPSIRLIENERNLGFVGSCNRGLSLRDHDAVLLNSDTRVTPGWLEAMLEVLCSHERIGAVCPLSNNATLCSVPEFGAPTDGERVDSEALDLSGLPLWTEVPTGVGFCLLLRSDLLDLAGALDPAFGRGYNEENDWCQRVQALGFFVARANRCFVYHLGQISFGDERNALDIVNARRLHRRFPHYVEQNRAFNEGPSARVAAIAARRTLGKLRVSLDLRHVAAPGIHGTANYATSLAESLTRLGDVRLGVRVSGDLMRRYCAERGVTVVEDEPADVVHYPTQLFDLKSAARALAETGHLIFTWQDLIAYRVPGALREWPRVETHRAVTWACLQAAQGLISISKSARDDLVTTFGLAPERIDVVPLGVDRQRSPASSTIRAKWSLPDRYFLVLGSDFPHKNLRFALEAWALLRGREGPRVPELVFAGPPSHVQGALSEAPPLIDGARFLGELPPDEVSSVLEGATALVFCSTYEGFGLPILEAMALGVPVVALPLSATREVAGDAALFPSRLTVDGLADALKQVCEAETRASLIARGRARASEFTWDRTARATVEVYQRVARGPPTATFDARRALASLLTSG